MMFKCKIGTFVSFWGNGLFRLVASGLRKLKAIITTGRLWEIDEDSDFLEES